MLIHSHWGLQLHSSDGLLVNGLILLLNQKSCHFLSQLCSQAEALTINLLVAMKNNIELCTASDFCAINCHAFFDGNTLPEDAGQFVQNWVKQISEAAGGKSTYFRSLCFLFGT